MVEVTVSSAVAMEVFLSISKIDYERQHRKPLLTPLCQQALGFPKSGSAADIWIINSYLIAIYKKIFKRHIKRTAGLVLQCELDHDVSFHVHRRSRNQSMQVGRSPRVRQ